MKYQSQVTEDHNIKKKILHGLECPKQLRAFSTEEHCGNKGSSKDVLDVCWAELAI